MIERMKTRLQLSEDQSAKLQVIMDDTHKQFSGLHETVKPQFEAIRTRMRERIREVLTEPQKSEFEKMCRELDQKMSRREKPN